MGSYVSWNCLKSSLYDIWKKLMVESKSKSFDEGLLNALMSCVCCGTQLSHVARTFNDKILKVCIIISFFSVSSASISIFIGIYGNKKHQKEFLPKLKWQFNNVSKVWVPTNWWIFSEIHFYQNFQQTIHEWNKIVWLELGLSTL